MSQIDGKGFSITDWYTFSAHGEIAGHASTAAAMPAITAKWVKFKADVDNAGNVYIGLAGVTVSAGSTTTTGGWPLSKGQETDWMPVPGGSLANMYYISDNNGDDLSYVVMV